MTEMFVTALLPPGNILATLQKVKNDLFVRFGYASVYALPAIIPVALTREPTPVPASHSIIHQPEVIHTTTTGLCDGLIVLPLAESAVIAKVRVRLSLPADNEASGSISPVNAIILGANEAADSPDGNRSLQEYLTSNTTRPLQWKRSDMVCFEFIESENPWWNACGIAYQWKRSLKSAPQ